MGCPLFPCEAAMKDQSDNFNLLVAPWIPVLYTNGKTDRIGIRQALTEAGKIRQIAASNPMDRVAITRFLLALLYWCQGNPPEGETVLSCDSFSPEWFEKLDRYKECFNLFGEGERFYQYSVPGGRREEKLAANYLMHEVPTGTNKWHFRHSTDKVEGLCPACCAMGLLRLPLFATSGGRGKPPGINSKPPIYAIPTGPSLSTTLRLSWRRESELGIASWERPDQSLPAAGVVPLLMGLTWLPRRVWLESPGLPEGRCISCGTGSLLIRESVFAGIGSTKTEGVSPGRKWTDPHVLYGLTKKGELTSLHAADFLGNSDAAGQWARIVAGLISKQGNRDKRVSTWIVGFSTVKNDKYLEAYEKEIRSPCAPFEVEEALQALERWQRVGSGFAAKFISFHEKVASRKHAEIPPLVAAIRPHVEERVAAKACELLTEGDEGWERAALEYRPLISCLARSLSPGCTTAAVQRRIRMAGATPDMRPKKEAAEKPRRSRGGDK